MSKNGSRIKALERRLNNAEPGLLPDAQVVPPEVLSHWRNMALQIKAEPVLLPDEPPRWNHEGDPLSEHNRQAVAYSLWLNSLKRLGHPAGVPEWDGTGSREAHYWPCYRQRMQRDATQAPQ